MNNEKFKQVETVANEFVRPLLDSFVPSMGFSKVYRARETFFNYVLASAREPTVNRFLSKMHLLAGVNPTETSTKVLDFLKRDDFTESDVLTILRQDLPLIILFINSKKA